MRYFLSLSLIVMLAACVPMEENARRAGTDIRNSYDDTRYKVSNWIYPHEKKVTYERPLDPRFCYRVQSDVLCYDNPQPHLCTVLIAAQDAGGIEHPCNAAAVAQNAAGWGGTASMRNTTTYDAAPVTDSSISISEAPAVLADGEQTPFYAAPSPAKADDGTNPPDYNRYGLDRKRAALNEPVDLM